LDGPSVPERILRRTGGGFTGVSVATCFLQFVEGSIEVADVEDQAGSDANRMQAWPDQAVERPALQAQVLHRLCGRQAAGHDRTSARWCEGAGRISVPGKGSEEQIANMSGSNGPQCDAAVVWLQETCAGTTLGGRVRSIAINRLAGLEASQCLPRGRRWMGVGALASAGCRRRGPTLSVRKKSNRKGEVTDYRPWCKPRSAARGASMV
jgi:hypothetical protein